MEDESSDRRRNAIRATAPAMIMAAPTASMTPVELPVTGRIAPGRVQVASARMREPTEMVTGWPAVVPVRVRVARRATASAPVALVVSTLVSVAVRVAAARPGTGPGLLART